jgi:hypothetical protein
LLCDLFVSRGTDYAGASVAMCGVACCWLGGD